MIEVNIPVQRVYCARPSVSETLRRGNVTVSSLLSRPDSSLQDLGTDSDGGLLFAGVISPLDAMNIREPVGPHPACRQRLILTHKIRPDKSLATARLAVGVDL